MNPLEEIYSKRHFSVPFLDEERLSYSHPGGSFSIKMQFISERIIYIESEGIIDVEYANRSNGIMEYIESCFIKEEKEISFYFINNAIKIKQYLPVASRIMQSFFDKRVRNKSYLHVAIISNDTLIKLYIKTSNFLRKRKINSAHNDYESASQYIFKLISLEEDSIADIQNNFKFESNEDKIERLEKENQLLKNELESNVDEITENIKKISSKESIEPIEYSGDEDSNLIPIYESLNFLNLDMQLMVRNLQEANKDLEDNVKNRVNEIRSIENRLQSVMAFSSDFICLLSTDRIIEYINPALLDYLRALYKVKIKRGEKWNEVLPREVVDLTQELINEAKSKGEARKFISTRKIQIDFTATVLIENNKAGAYLIIGRNVSEFSETLNQLTKSRENYKFITDNINDVIWTHTEDHDLNWISPSITRQRGFSQDEYMKMSIEETMTIKSANELNKIIRSKDYLNYSIDKPMVFLSEYIKKDGSIMYGESNAYPVFEENKFKGILGITRDVSDRINNLNKIEQQNSELESILNNTDEQIISINRNLEYVTLNEVAKNFVRQNFNTEPQIGESILKYMSDANRSKIQVAFNKVLKGDNYHYTFRFPRNNKIEYLEARFRPIFLNNEVFGISLFIKNISENIYIQIALKENEQRLKRITDSALEGVWEYSYKSSGLYLSSRLKELVAYRGENNVDEFSNYIRTIMEAEEHDKLISSIIKKINEKDNFEIAARVKLEGKSEKWLLIRASISQNIKKAPHMISGVLIDISIQKEQEEELKKAKEKAEEMMQLKSNFLANMSHEVRTPLNGILGVTQLLEKEGLPEEINYYLKLQRESGLRLLDTINNILSLSRMDASGTNEEFESVNLHTFIDNNLDPFKILAKQKGLELKFSRCCDDIVIPMNEHLFYQVFNNLLGNAIKFTLKGHIEVITEIKNNNALLIVQDTGVGIAPEFLTKIFNAFEQESTGISRNFEGSGLGLAIVKMYIDKIGGDIKVESEKNVGTRFTLLLPLQKGGSEKSTV